MLFTLARPYIFFNYFLISFNITLISSTPKTPNLQTSHALNTAIIQQEYGKALQLHQQYPEIMQDLAHQVFIEQEILPNLPLFTINPSDQRIPEEQLQLISRFIEHNYHLCKHIPKDTYQHICNHALQNPARCNNLVRALIQYCFSNDTDETDDFLCSIATNENLPPDLNEYLFQKQNDSDPADHSPSLQTPRKPTNNDCHVAIEYTNHPSCFTLHTDRLKSGDQKILPLILYFLGSKNRKKQCKRILNVTLWSYPHITKEAIQKAKFYNPSCLIFLEQFENWLPQYHDSLTKEDYATIYHAYHKFMLDHDPELLQFYLKPHLKEKLDPVTQNFRSFFKRKKIVMPSCNIPLFHDKYNVTYLYQELLPALQNPDNTPLTHLEKTDDDLFVEAILAQEHNTIAQMLQTKLYNPNCYYVGSHHSEYFGTPPIFIAIINQDPVAVELLLQNLKDTTTTLPLSPAWAEDCSIAHFALHSCFAHYNQYLRSIIQLQHLKKLSTTRNITDLRDISFQNHIKNSSLNQNQDILIAEQIRYQKSLQILEITLQYSKLQQQEPHYPNFTIENILLHHTVQFISMVNSGIRQQLEKNHPIISEILSGIAAEKTGKKSPACVKDILDILLDNGANPHIITDENISLSELASRMHHHTLAAYIAQYKAQHPVSDYVK